MSWSIQTPSKYDCQNAIDLKIQGQCIFSTLLMAYTIVLSGIYRLEYRRTGGHPQKSVLLPTISQLLILGRRVNITWGSRQKGMQKGQFTGNVG